MIKVYKYWKTGNSRIKPPSPPKIPANLSPCIPETPANTDQQRS